MSHHQLKWIILDAVRYVPPSETAFCLGVGELEIFQICEQNQALIQQCRHMSELERHEAFEVAFDGYQKRSRIGTEVSI